MSSPTTDHPMVVSHFRVGPEIGRGSFANVYKGYDIRTKAPVAVKSVFRNRLKNQKLIDNLEVEISILKNLKNPHIVALLDCVQTDTHFHLFMEYCSLGDLSFFIRKRNQLVKHHPLIRSLLERYPSPAKSKGMNEVLVINFIKQLASALKFLRSQNLVHRDIKPQNLLLCPPVNSEKEFDRHGYAGMWELPILKIADFGFARFLPSTSMAETLCGSPLYMAPEILRCEKYNAKADLWSVGAVIYEMAVGKPPFRAANHVELLKKIENARDQITFPSSAHVSERLMKLICSLLKASPTDRMSFSEFFDDPVVVDNVQHANKPLARSVDDDQLFISAYLPKSKKIVYDEPPKSPMESITKKVEDISLNEEEPNPKNEQLKSILFQNRSPQWEKEHSSRSPSPDTTKLHHEYLTDNKLVEEKDYVIVKKRTVEVNALADELNMPGSGASAITFHTDHRRFSFSGIVGSSALARRKPSFSSRKTPLSISPTNALSKALGYTSSRLFGIERSRSMHVHRHGSIDSWDAQALQQEHQQEQKADSGAKILEHNISDPLKSMLFRRRSSGGMELAVQNGAELLQDNEVISRLETLDTMAHAISLFAEVKFNQLIPMPPSSRASSHASIDGISEGEGLPFVMVKSISEEGLALYMKTLSLLAEAMNVASQWWIQNRLKVSTSPRMNELVQWTRSKFNECLEKAEFLRLRLANATRKLATSDTKEPVVAEKLIFDRALEVSKNAAMHELKKDDLQGCELRYSTAIWMLEALLNDYDGQSKTTKGHIDSNDKKTIETFINVISQRLRDLQMRGH